MTLNIFITILLVLMNGFFVAAEFAIVKVRASQLEIKIQSGNQFALLAKNIISHLDAYLAATQLGITLASLGLGWIGEPVVSVLIENLLHRIGIEIKRETAHDIALPVAFAIITILHIVFGELAPKSLAIQRSERTRLIIAYPLRLFYIIFKPFIWILNGIANMILKLFGIHAVHGYRKRKKEKLFMKQNLKAIIKMSKQSSMKTEILLKKNKT